MRVQKARRPLQFHQLCAIAKTVIEADRTITDGEWKVRVKELAARQGYANPTTPMLAEALTRVEKAVERQYGLRQVTEPSRAPRAARGVLRDRPWPRPHLLSQRRWTSVRDLIQELQRSVPSVSSCRTSTPPDADHDQRVRQQVSEWRATESMRPVFTRTTRGWVPVKGQTKS
jgi:hypothetical protein